MSYDALTRSAAAAEPASSGPPVDFLGADDSELDLSLRLELARHNSLTHQHTGTMLHVRHTTTEETIVEGELFVYFLCSFSQCPILMINRINR